jgi:hypothetical protein
MTFKVFRIVTQLEMPRSHCLRNLVRKIRPATAADDNALLVVASWPFLNGYSSMASTPREKTSQNLRELQG